MNSEWTHQHAREARARDYEIEERNPNPPPPSVRKGRTTVRITRLHSVSAGGDGQ